MLGIAEGRMRWWRTESLEARHIRDEELEWFLRVLCASFGLDYSTARRFFYDDPYFEVNQRWGLWLHERAGRTLVSVATAIPLQILLNGRAVACYGIAGVATLPEYRRRGFANHLLQQMLHALYAERAPLAILQAFNHDFYRKLGWETVSVIAHARLEPKQLPRYETVPLRRVTPADAPAVKAFYERHYLPRTGSLVRDERRWEYLFWNLPNLWLCEFAGQLEGYIFYDFLDSGWTLRVRELLWSTERARRALLGWLAANEESVRHVEFQMSLEQLASLRLMGWHLPPSEPTQPMYSVQIVPNLMARPIHAHALLQALLEGVPAPKGFQSFNLRVRDSVLSENSTAVGFVAQNGRVRLTNGLPDAPTLSVAPTVLAMIAFGTLSVPELRARRMLSVPDTLVDALDALFPEQSPCLTPIDFF